ncbi:MAG: hypothetical protein ACLTCI_12630 [[Clostridium] nexile]
MTSKISCIKFIKEDLRQRTWLIAILSTVTFLFQPLMLIIGINEKTNWINTVTPGCTMKDFKFCYLISWDLIIMLSSSV